MSIQEHDDLTDMIVGYLNANDMSKIS